MQGLLLTFWRIAQMSQSGLHSFPKKSFLFIASALRCEYRKGLHQSTISDHCWPEQKSTRQADICCPLLEYVSEDSEDDSMWFCFYQMFPFGTFLTISGFIVNFLAYLIKNSLLSYVFKILPKQKNIFDMEFLGTQVIWIHWTRSLKTE